MSTYFLALFLILFGVMNLIETKIPGWVLGVSAFAAAVAVLIGSVPWKKSP